MSKLVLIDGNSLLHRAYHALPPLATPRGEPSHAVYGFTSMLLKVIDELKPTFVAVAWDTGKPTFRHQEYLAYKEQRPKMPQDLFDQLEMTKRVVEAFNIPQFALEGYEADDVVGTLAKQAVRHPHLKPQARDHKGPRVVIVTGDLDLLQLVDEGVGVFAPRKGFSQTIIYDVERVKERFGGLVPSQIVDYKALKGDPSDNLPGVRGVGEKTAIKLLKKYKSLEEIYRHLDELEPRVREKLIEGQEDAFLSKKLARIDTSAPVKLDLEKMRLADYDNLRVRRIFQEYGFRSLLSRLPHSEREKKEKQDLLFEDLTQGPLVSTPASILDELDLKIAAHLLSGETGKRLSLENLAFTYLGEEVRVETLGEKELLRLYSVLQRKLLAELEREENVLLKKLFYEVELPLKPILRQMEKWGILVDTQLLEELTQKYARALKEIELEIYREIGYEFNLNSPRQLEEILFDELKLPVIRRTKTQRSTNESVLTKLVGAHPVIEKLLRYRKLSKLKSTYLDPLPGMLNKGHRVHTTFSQIKTASGRLSSENPNLQNIPKGDADNLRRLFLAPQGCQLLVVDYSQIELRILAHLSQDKGLLDAFRHNLDVHAATAARLFNKTIDKVTLKERQVGKTVNFALMYGMSEFGLAESLGIDRGRAKLYIESYFKNYPGVKEWQEKHLERVRERGYVESLFGRRRYLAGLRSSNYRVRSAAERVAINHPMQATQADIIKKAMLRINGALVEQGWWGEKVKMLLQVHDELIFEVAEENLREVAAQVKSLMETVVELSVPLLTKVQVGQNWGDLTGLAL